MISLDCNAHVVFFRISAFEYENGRVSQTVPSSRAVVGQHLRQALLKGLTPGVNVAI